MSVLSTRDHVIDKLACNARGIPLGNHSNVVYVLQHDAAWTIERFWYDEFLDRVFVASSPVRQWRDDDDTKVTVEMQSEFGILGVSQHVVQSAIQYVARQRTRHVVREYLEALAWDGIPRIATAFEDYWGAESSPYVEAASRNFLVGMAARILKPGCKLDTMPVFEGAQGTRKSSALQMLGGAWYSVAHESVSSKDFLQGMRGFWLIEIAELESFTRAEVNAVKGMMSNSSDNYRPSYGRHVMRYPRQSVFGGTTNNDDWGSDSTGLRRFWPVRCGDIRLDLLAAARDQLFAEAVQAVRADATWWDMPDSTKTEQADRQHFDEWSEPALKWANVQPEAEGVALKDIAKEALGIPLGQVDRKVQNRLAGILRLHGWLRGNRRDGERVSKVWRKRDTGAEVFEP